MTNMFSFKYQLALNDMYNFGNFELLGYAMALTRLETINFFKYSKQVRFNIRQIDYILI